MWLCSAERSHPAIYCHRYGLTSIGLEQVLDILSSRCQRGPPVNRQTMVFTVGVPWYAPPVMLNRICSPDKDQGSSAKREPGCYVMCVFQKQSPCRPIVPMSHRHVLMMMFVECPPCECAASRIGPCRMPVAVRRHVSK